MQVLGGGPKVRRSGGSPNSFNVQRQHALRLCSDGETLEVLAVPGEPVVMSEGKTGMHYVACFDRFFLNPR